jgi:hypothetical protein
MREFKTSFDGKIVNLDDPRLYDYLPYSVSLLDDLMFKEIGYALCYMNNFHPDIFKNHRMDGGQRKRVMKLIENFCNERKDHLLNSSASILWYQEQVFLFQDETENMC